jgi:hypothetical protein
VSDAGALVLFLASGAALFGGIMLFWRHAGRSIYHPPLPYYREAARYVWLEVYGQTPKSMPAVWWIRIHSRNRCAPGCYLGRQGQCVGGEALLDVSVVQIGWEDGHHAWLADTALAHELAHFVYATHGPQHSELAARGAAKLREWEAIRA